MTTGARLVELSRLPAGTALAHFLAIRLAGGVQTVFATLEARREETAFSETRRSDAPFEQVWAQFHGEQAMQAVADEESVHLCFD